MIGTLLRIDWLNLKRDPVALGLTFVLPIVFFSIFAAIFGGMGGGGGGSGSLTILAVDEDGSAVSRKLIDALDDQDALRVLTAPTATEESPDPAPFTRDDARRRVRQGDAPAAIVIPPGFGASFGDFGRGAAPIELIHDPSNPLAQHTVAGLLQASAMMAAPDVLMERGLEQLETFGGALTPGQRQAVDSFLPVLRGERPWSDLDANGPDGEDDADDASAASPARPGGGADAPISSETADAGDGPAFTGLVEVRAVSAREADPGGARGGSGTGSIVSYYAAGIGVMFLLFSLVGASGGALLQEEESGTLERLLASRLGMGALLTGHWLFFSVLGAVQLAVMFVWGAFAFGLDLFTPSHLAGFAAMTVATAAAAAAFAIALATLCKSRAQLNGISTIVILIMSALGGSMVPRFVMPAFMNTTALFTFNGWALDGYLKVFWYDDPEAGVIGSLVALLPQLAVLAALTVVFLAIARLLARRWETT